MNVLTINDLSKSFGSQKIIDGMNLTVPEGSIFGFIGQNGAGKTTTMKMVLGLLEADKGKIFVCNEAVHFGQTKANQAVGYLPDVPEFYNYMNPQQYLNLCGEIIGLPSEEIANRSAKLLSLVGLGTAKKRIGGFSRGMKQRLGIAQALLTRPKLLICDEPTSALDPVGRMEILDILRKIKGSTTVLFSTHILSDVERVCDHVAVLHGGKISMSGTLSDIKTMHGHDSLSLVFRERRDSEKFKSYTTIKPYLQDSEETDEGIILHGQDMKNIQRVVILALAETGLCPVAMEFVEPSLEKLFLEVIQ